MGWAIGLAMDIFCICLSGREPGCRRERAGLGRNTGGAGARLKTISIRIGKWG